MVKLALLDRAGTDSRSLLTAQREQLAPIGAALADRLARAEGFDRTLARWRYETVSAALRFLDAAITPEAGPGPTAPAAGPGASSLAPYSGA
jgi:hypothetical protein